MQPQVLLTDVPEPVILIAATLAREVGSGQLKAFQVQFSHAAQSGASADLDYWTSSGLRFQFPGMPPISAFPSRYLFWGTVDIYKGGSTAGATSLDVPDPAAASTVFSLPLTPSGGYDAKITGHKLFSGFHLGFDSTNRLMFSGFMLELL
jgi:hypothetical protein